MILLRQSTTVPNTSKVRALIEAGSMALLRRACYDGRDGQGKRGPDDGSAVTLTTEATMIAMWVKVRIKSEMREKFFKAIEVDALGSERDEPGCLRFNVLQDEKEPNVYDFYEDQAALEAHRNTPHYAVWCGVADVLDGSTELTRCQTVFPAVRPY